MTTFISIRQQTWKNWDPTDPESAIAYLNRLLVRHAVKLELAPSPTGTGEDCLSLRARVLPYEEWRRAMKAMGM